MKSLFVVHSPLAAVMFVLIQKRLRLQNSDCAAVVVRLDRRYSRWLSFRGVNNGRLSLRVLHGETLSRAEREREVRRLDQLLEAIVGKDDFQLFTFDSVSGLNQLLITHPQNRGTHLVEEGLMHRMDSVTLRAHHFVEATDQGLFSPHFPDRFFSSGIVSDRVDGFFSFSTQAFPGVVATNVFDRPTASALAQREFLGNLVLLPGYRPEDRSQMLEDLAMWRESVHPRKVVLKFHPGMGKDERRYWSAQTSKIFGQRAVSSRRVMFAEAEILAGNVASVVAWSSSTLLYAREWGVPCMNLDPIWRYP